MRLAIVAVGRLKAGPERELADMYRQRTAKAGRSIGFQAVDVLEIAESRAGRPQDRMNEEGRAITAAIPADAVRVALDAGGTALTSEKFAARLASWRDDGRPAVCFAIGGADGLAAEIKQRADLTLSFGAATWPHQLVRIMLLEQLYRAVTIVSGHPYHRC